MKTNKSVSVEDCKITISFQSLRKTLLNVKFADRLEKRLAYWAMPDDRQLPFAFLGRTIKELLETPFEELSATPGIGQKKISCFLKILSRAAKDRPPVIRLETADLTVGLSRAVPGYMPCRQNTVQVDPSVVSEAHWAAWRETVNRHGFGCEKLGRLAPTLQPLPMAIWHTPLEFYSNYSVAEIRQLPRYDEKGVRVVLEVFYLIHQMVSAPVPSKIWSVRMVPKSIEPLECWTYGAIARAKVPTTDEVRDNFSMPLLNQLRIDAGDTVFELSQGRIGINSSAKSVQDLAKQLGVPGTRVNKLLESCGKIMNVRWPEGQYLLAAFSRKLKAVAKPGDDLKLFRSTVALCFPGQHLLLGGGR